MDAYILNFQKVILNFSFCCFLWLKKISLIFQFLAALEYLLNNAGQPFNAKDFEVACGVGVVVSPEEIEDAVSIYYYFDSWRF